MDTYILDQLNNYCSKLIGETPKKSLKKQTASHIIISNDCKKINSKKRKEIDHKNDYQNNDSINKLSTSAKIKKINLNNSGSELQDNPILSEMNVKDSSYSKDIETKDGFKIKSELPPDDSDVSDAFESDLDESEWLNDAQNRINAGKIQKNLKDIETEDGFKIKSELPPDDSDVSDAFESDLDESEWLNDAQNRINAGQIQKNISDSLQSSIPKDDHSQLSSIRKPLMKIMQDFGLEKQISFDEHAKPQFKNTKLAKTQICQGSKPKCLTNQELNIVDYSSKRGKRKKLKNKNKDDDKNIDMQKEMEKSFKKNRYEIYKFGLTAFHTNEKKNAKIELAVKLGAKPPKNMAKNYKKIMDERKKKKEEEVNKREETRQMGLPVPKPKKERLKKSNPEINPLIGTFKDGVLRLSQKDIESVSAKR